MMRKTFVALFTAALLIGTAALASAEGRLIWADSFETTEPGAHPADWTTRYAADHDPDTGPRVVDSAASDGSKSLKIVDRKAGISAIAYRLFDPLEKGRIVLDAMVPSEDGGFLNVEIRIGGNRVFGVDMHRSNGYWRYRDAADQLIATDVELTYDEWHELVIEWDATARKYHAYVRNAEGELVRFTPEGGADFNMLRFGTPNRLELRVGSSTNTDLQIGYVDNIRVYALE